MIKEKEKEKLNPKANGLDCMRRIAAKAYGKKLINEQSFKDELNSYNRLYEQDITPSQVLFWALVSEHHVLVEQIYDFVMSDMKQKLRSEKNPDIREVTVTEAEIIEKMYNASLSRELRRH